MTPEQKKRRILEIEKDVQQIMHQLNHIEFKIGSNLVERDRIMEIFMPRPKKNREFFDSPTIKMPNMFKKLWVGFLDEMKKAP